MAKEMTVPEILEAASTRIGSPADWLLRQGLEGIDEHFAGLAALQMIEVAREQSVSGESGAEQFFAALVASLLGGFSLGWEARSMIASGEFVIKVEPPAVLH